MKSESVYLNKENQNDNVYVEVESRLTKDIFGGEVNNNISQAIVSNGKLVQTCSPRYHILNNKDFFGRMEHQLIDEGIGYKMRSYNINDSKFYVDFILDDESKKVHLHNNSIKGVDDNVVPMIRLTNSYDGSMKTAGYLGYYRKVCNNGLHVSHMEIDFSVKHTRNKIELFMPNIDEILGRFMQNENYSIVNKMETLQARIIDPKNIQNWIQALNEQDRVFSATKEKDNELIILPMAQLVEDIVIRDANATSVEPNAWLLYSAFNEVIHSQLQTNSYTNQKKLDNKAFNGLVELVEHGATELIL